MSKGEIENVPGMCGHSPNQHEKHMHRVGCMWTRCVTRSGEHAAALWAAHGKKGRFYLSSYFLWDHQVFLKKNPQKIPDPVSGRQSQGTLSAFGSGEPDPPYAHICQWAFLSQVNSDGGAACTSSSDGGTLLSYHLSVGTLRFLSASS